MDDLDRNIARIKAAVNVKLAPRTYATDKDLNDRVAAPSTFTVSAAPLVKAIEPKRQPSNGAVIAQPQLRQQLPDQDNNEGVSDGGWAWLKRKLTWTDRH